LVVGVSGYSSLSSFEKSFIEPFLLAVFTVLFSFFKGGVLLPYNTPFKSNQDYFKK
jgi:hypothetical protein